MLWGLRGRDMSQRRGKEYHHEPRGTGGAAIALGFTAAADSARLWLDLNGPQTRTA
jgi:hypothetical protein